MIDGWHRTELGSHVDLTTGFPFSSSEYAEGPGHIRLLRGDNIVPGDLRWEGVKHWRPELIAGLETYFLADGDLVMAMDRTWVNSGLKIARINSTDLPCLLVQRVARLRAAGALDQDFMAQCVASYSFEQYVKGNQTETAVPHISAQQIRDFPIYLPPLHEQRKIAAILGTWDAAIAKVRTLRLTKLRRLYGVAQRLLAPTRAIGRDLVPTHWEPCTLGEVFAERQDRNGQLKAEDVVTVGKYAIRKQSEHFTRSVASVDLSNYWIISPGDFVYDPMSAYYGAVGRYAGASNGLVSPAYRVLRVKEDVSPEFMEHLLRSHHIRFLFEARSSQGNRDGKRRLLQRDEFESIEFMMPPEPEQARIAQTLADFRLDVAETQRLLDRLETQKRGLMQKLLTGEWRLPC